MVFSRNADDEGFPKGDTNAKDRLFQEAVKYWIVRRPMPPQRPAGSGAARDLVDPVNRRKTHRRDSTMKRTGVVALAVALILSLAAGGWASDKAMKSGQKKAPPEWKTSTMVEETATVEAVDQKTRMVTLKGAKGNEITFKAGPEVRNLAQVKVGDVVRVSYYEALDIRVLKEGEQPPATGEVSTMARAKKGEMPGGVAGSATTVVVKITAIDMKAKTVLLEGEDGNSVTITPRPPDRLKKVKVGDRLVVTYTEAIAINVERVKK